MHNRRPYVAVTSLAFILLLNVSGGLGFNCTLSHTVIDEDLQSSVVPAPSVRQFGAHQNVVNSRRRPCLA